MLIYERYCNFPKKIEIHKDILCVRFSNTQVSSVCAGLLQHCIEREDPDYDPATPFKWLQEPIVKWDTFMKQGISKVYSNRSFLISESALFNHILEYQSIQLILDMLPNLEILILVGDGKYLREITEHLITELGDHYHLIECNYRYPRQCQIKIHPMSMALGLIDSIFINCLENVYDSYRIKLSSEIIQILEKIRSDVLTDFEEPVSK